MNLQDFNENICYVVIVVIKKPFSYIQMYLNFVSYLKFRLIWWFKDFLNYCHVTVSNITLSMQKNIRKIIFFKKTLNVIKIQEYTSMSLSNAWFIFLIMQMMQIFNRYFLFIYSKPTLTTLWTKSLLNKWIWCFCGSSSFDIFLLIQCDSKTVIVWIVDITFTNVIENVKQILYHFYCRKYKIWKYCCITITM